jgi:hypothetical protein
MVKGAGGGGGGGGGAGVGIGVGDGWIPSVTHPPKTSGKMTEEAKNTDPFITLKPPILRLASGRVMSRAKRASRSVMVVSPKAPRTRREF